MKKYKILEIIVFAIGKQEYSCKPGDVIELDENHITTRALVERKRIEESAEEQPSPDDAPEGKQVQLNPDSAPEENQEQPNSDDAPEENKEQPKPTSKKK